MKTYIKKEMKIEWDKGEISSIKKNILLMIPKLFSSTPQ